MRLRLAAAAPSNRNLPLRPGPMAAPVSQAVITAGLNTLMETWPESLRLEILQTNLADARIAMPVDAVETALKRGRVTFAWKTIRSWITPATPTTVSVHDAAELELPLKVIAPLFLARKHSGNGQNKIAVDEAIPNLFFGFPQPEAPARSSPAVAPVAPATQFPSGACPTFRTKFAGGTSAAAASSAAASAAAAAAGGRSVCGNASAAKPVDTNYYLWDDASDTNCSTSRRSSKRDRAARNS
jgi:hypothetical protein